MAQVIIQTIDKISADRKTNLALYKAGDVIDVVEDSQIWTENELTNPKYRIISLPGVPKSDIVDALLEGEDPELVAEPIRRLRKIDYSQVARLGGKDRGNRQSQKDVVTPAEANSITVLKSRIAKVIG